MIADVTINNAEKIAAMTVRAATNIEYVTFSRARLI
jgi:hypothetical protein